ncbi:MAG: T9SS type A sorting domain-containing protein [Ferruginibacter sp.]
MKIKIINKRFFKRLLFLLFMVLFKNISEAQICAGTWVTNDPINYQCVNPGQYVGRFTFNGEPSGCPINPSYTANQTNTFMFDNPVSGFIIDFIAFSGADCARLEVKINGVFYHLTTSNLLDYPPLSGCVGSVNLMAITPDGYLTGAPSTPINLNGQGRITIDGVYATSVTVSTNDGAGSIFGIPYNCLPVVPLELKSFKGSGVSDCKAILSWESGVESNIKNIEALQSADGIIFKKVAEVIPKGSDSHYLVETDNYTDSYFKLKINDLDGSFRYSEILNVKSNCERIAYEISPNPTQNSMKIKGLKKDDKVVISDIIGRIVLRFNSYQGDNKLDIQKLASGMYYLKIIKAGVIMANIKFIKA